MIGESVIQTLADGFIKRFPLKWDRAREKHPSSASLDNEQIEVKEKETKRIWKESFKGFYEKYHRPFWFYIYKICGDEGVADDIFQEAFFRYLQAEPIHLNEYQRKSYLYKTAYHLMIDQKRKRNTEQKHVNQFNGKDKEFENSIFLALDMQKTFALLKPKERNLLWLAYAEGHSHGEIAGIVSGSVNSIKVQLFRARKKMAKILQNQGYKQEDQNEKK